MLTYAFLSQVHNTIQTTYTIFILHILILLHFCTTSASSAEHLYAIGNKEKKRNTAVCRPISPLYTTNSICYTAICTICTICTVYTYYTLLLYLLILYYIHLFSSPTDCTQYVSRRVFPGLLHLLPPPVYVALHQRDDS